MNLQQIAQQIKENEIEYIGIRTLADDEQYEVGDFCRDSYEWDGENDCSTYDLEGEEGESADGTCATNVDTDYAYEIEEIIEELEIAIAKNKGYAGAKRVVIAGRTTSTDGVFDEGEVRLVDAYVVAYV